MARKRLPKDMDPRVPFNPDRFVDKTTHTVTCLVARQFDTDIFLGFLPLSILATGGYVDLIDPLSLKAAGCQRESNRRRIAKIGSEFDSRKQPMLDPLLVNVKRSSVKVSKSKKPGDTVAHLELTIDPADRTLLITDGQHRGGGMAFSDKVPNDFPVPVLFTIGLDNLRLRRIVSDIGGNMVKHNKAFLGTIAASLMHGQRQGKISGAYNEDDPVEVRRFKSNAAADVVRSMSDSPLHNRMTLLPRDSGGRIPMSRLADMIDWVLARSRKFNALDDPMSVSFVLIDFFRAIRVLVGDEFSDGVMLSTKGMKVLSRLLWHVAEEFVDDTPEGCFYRGTREGQYADTETRYEQVLDLLRPLLSWQSADGDGESRWLKCHSDKQTSVNTWYALMLISLGWETRPSCVKKIQDQIAMLKDSSS